MRREPATFDLHFRCAARAARSAVSPSIFPKLSPRGALVYKWLRLEPPDGKNKKRIHIQRKSGNSKLTSPKHLLIYVYHVSGGSRISQRRVLLKKARIARAKISEPRPFARWPRLL